MKFHVELRHTRPNENPEYATAELEAKDEKSLRALIEEYAQEIAAFSLEDYYNAPADAKPARPRFRPGWESRGEPEFWGRDEGVEVLNVETATARAARLKREAAKAAE